MVRAGDVNKDQAEKATARPVLDRRVEFDPRSRAYDVRTLLREAHAPRSYTWSCGVVLDQGTEGACVGFAWAHEIAARPVIRPANLLLARSLYRRAQQLDQWPGEDYDGTSVLAGAKAVAEARLLSSYRWAFGLDDLVLALGYRGPAVLGLNWYESMWRPDGDGILRVGGRVVGGHAILARGVSVRTETVLLHNSWGPSWGDRGTARITFTDLDRLLREDGEACVPVVRL